MPDTGKFKDLYLNSAHTYPCQGGRTFRNACAADPSATGSTAALAVTASAVSDARVGLSSAM